MKNRRRKRKPCSPALGDGHSQPPGGTGGERRAGDSPSPSMASPAADHRSAPSELRGLCPCTALPAPSSVGEKDAQSRNPTAPLGFRVALPTSCAANELGDPAEVVSCRQPGTEGGFCPHIACVGPRAVGGALSTSPSAHILLTVSACRLLEGRGHP